MVSSDHGSSRQLEKKKEKRYKEEANWRNIMREE